MTRNLKTLGLALVAAMAMTALTASAANAQFEADKVPVTLTAGQTTQHVFETAEGDVTCTTAEFHGEQNETPVTEVTITPVYTDCEAAGLEAEITGFGHYGESEGPETVANPCDYVFHADGTVDLVCGEDPHDGEGHVVIDTAGGCDITIPEQTELATVTYENEGVSHKVEEETISTPDTDDVLVTADVEDISYENTGHTFLCTLAGITHYDEMTHDGTYDGASTLIGEDPISGAHIGIEAHKEE
jgi:hypothetical protein